MKYSPAQEHFDQRIALGVNYDGSGYHGWQLQDNDQLKTVQRVVERAVSEVANHAVSVTCAGRTDAHVHATGQVVHFDTNAVRSDEAWLFGINSNLPRDVSVSWVKPVNFDFHARFSALARRYRYLIYNHRSRPAILRHAVSHYYRWLDVDAMQEAARHWIGEYDFTSFRAAGCQARHARRRVDDFTVSRQRDLLVIEVSANGFLHHMVRNFVGVLLEVGAGQQPSDWAKQVLKAKDRKAGGVTARPQGLYLVHVAYPEEFDLPEEPLGPFFLP